MKTLIVGTNAQACFAGSRLLQAGVATSFLTSAARADEIRRHGMIVRSPGAHFHASVHAITPDAITSPFDVVIFTTRAHKFTFARAAAMASTGPATIVLPFNFDPIAHAIMEQDDVGTVVGAVPDFAVELLPDGTVRHTGAPPSLVLGKLTASADGVDIAERLFSRTDIDVKISQKVREDVWAQFVGRAAHAVASPWPRTRKRQTIPGNGREIVRMGFQIGAARGLKLGARNYEFALTLERSLFAGSQDDEAVHNLKTLIRLGQEAGVDVDSLSRIYEERLRNLPGGASDQHA